jgi:hypothetical protein
MFVDQKSQSPRLNFCRQVKVGSWGQDFSILFKRCRIWVLSGQVLVDRGELLLSDGPSDGTISLWSIIAAEGLDAGSFWRDQRFQEPDAKLSTNAIQKLALWGGQFPIHDTVQIIFSLLPKNRPLQTQTWILQQMSQNIFGGCLLENLFRYRK